MVKKYSLLIYLFLFLFFFCMWTVFLAWMFVSNIIMLCCQHGSPWPSLTTCLSSIAPGGGVIQVTSCNCIELLYIGSSWSFNLCSSVWRGPQLYIAYEFVSINPFNNLDAWHFFFRCKTTVCTFLSIGFTSLLFFCCKKYLS